MHNIFTRSLLLVSAILASTTISVLPARGNLIVNGGFETPPTSEFTNYTAGSTAITGWTVISGSVDLVRSTFYPAYAGFQTLDLDGYAPGAIEQSFATVIGATYSLEFRYGNNPVVGASFPAMAMIVLGSNPTPLLNTNLIHGDSTQANMNYSLYSALFTADATTTKLRFTSSDPANSLGGIAFDEVAVNIVPEPSSLATLFLGAPLLMRRLRRRCAR